jgi:small-conductance mechanosensitive channel
METFWEQNYDAIRNIGISTGILIATLLVGFLVGNFLKGVIKRSTKALDIDPTNYHFIRHLIVAIIYIIGIGAAVQQIEALKQIANSLLAGAGILAVAVGFASQHALSNIVSGLFIVLFKPFRINDRVALKDGSQTGVIEDITLRHVVIRDFQNRRIIVPNSIISNEIILNADFNEEKICRWIELPISFESDIQKAKAIIAEEIEKHPLHLDTRSEEDKANNKPVTVRVIQFGEYFMLLRGWAWAKDQADGFVMACDLFESIKARFDEAGITIPYPHRTITPKD